MIKKVLSMCAESSETVSQGGTELTKTTLSYSRTGRSDMGHYLCIANNSVPPSVSKRITLSVRFRVPEVVMSHQMIGVHLGDDVTINCTVTAFPPPVVFWTHRTGKMIISAGRYQVTEMQVKDSPPVVLSTLSIAAVTAVDVTTYTCTAIINNDINRSKSLTVQLNGECCTGGRVLHRGQGAAQGAGCCTGGKV
ncbi:Immunoglobulin-like domain [Trinorchestia longiramus]|nr:Immunoglobulin-like domain [Trinorchestia longiramus]